MKKSLAIGALFLGLALSEEAKGQPAIGYPGVFRNPVTGMVYRAPLMYGSPYLTPGANFVYYQTFSSIQQKEKKKTYDEKTDDAMNMILKYLDERSDEIPMQFETYKNMYGYLADIFITKQRAGEEGYTQGTVIKFRRKIKGADFGAYGSEDAKKMRKELESRGIALIYVKEPEEIMKNPISFFAKLNAMLDADYSLGQTKRYVRNFEDEGMDGHAYSDGEESVIQKKISKKK